MAVVECDPIRSPEHLQEALRYIMKETKTYKDLIHGENCDPATAYDDFSLVKKLHGKEGNILAHHITQNFKIGETDYKTANEIGRRFAEAAFPGYQYVLVTHIDREYMHNHIILNSVHPTTGYKYLSNKESLAELRRISDRLCKENGLSVIEQTEKKPEAVAAVDRAMDKSRNIKEFCENMREQGYIVKVTQKNITLIKAEAEGKSRGTRLDTLAKHYGYHYSKKYIESYFSQLSTASPKEAEQINEELQDRRKKFDDKRKSFIKNVAASDAAKETQGREWKRYERFRLSDGARQIMSLKQSMLHSPSFSSFAVRAFMFLLAYSDKKARNEYKQFFARNKSLPSKMDVVECDKADRKTFGNVSYRRLIEAQGENISIRISPEKISNLYGIKAFYSGTVYNDGYAKITFKKNKENVLEIEKALEIKNIKDYEIEKKSTDAIKKPQFEKSKHFGNITYGRLVLLDNGEKESIWIDEEEQKKLVNAKFLYSGIIYNNGKIKITFCKADQDSLRTLLNIKNMEKRKVKIPRKQSIGNVSYQELKEREGEIKEIRLPADQLHQIRKAKLDFAGYVYDSGFIKIAFEVKNTEKVLEALDITDLSELAIKPFNGVKGSNKEQFGNIAYSDLITSEGENFVCKIPKEAIPLLKPLLKPYSGVLFESGFCKVTFKKSDLDAFQDALEGVANLQKNQITKRKPYKTFGNIPYSELTKSEGENITIRIGADKIPLLCNVQMLYSGILNKDGTAKVTFKKENQRQIEEAFGENIEKITIRRPPEGELYTLFVDKAEKEAIIGEGFYCTAASYGNQFKIAVRSEDLSAITALIGKDAAQVERTHQEAVNNAIYAQLKKEAAQQQIALQYRVVPISVVDALKNAVPKMAVFPKDDNRCNIAILPEDVAKYEIVLEKESREQAQKKDLKV